MRLQQYINEKRVKDVIVVDVQPHHKRHISFNMNEFTVFLEEQRKILYFYNGSEVGSGDTEVTVTNFLLKNGLNEDKIRRDITFVEKGYGFFRTWMDYDIDEKTIKKALNYMIINRINDSRDIPNEKMDEIFPDHEKYPYIEEDPIFIPDFIKISNLRKWKGSYLCGGGRNECLKEIQILLNLFNIKYTLVKRFIYG